MRLKMKISVAINKEVKIELYQLLVKVLQLEGQNKAPSNVLSAPNSDIPKMVLARTFIVSTAIETIAVTANPVANPSKKHLGFSPFTIASIKPTRKTVVNAKATSNITIGKTVAAAGTAEYSKADAVNPPIPAPRRKPPSSPPPIMYAPAPDSGSKIV